MVSLLNTHRFGEIKRKTIRLINKTYYKLLVIINKFNCLYIVHVFIQWLQLHTNNSPIIHVLIQLKLFIDTTIIMQGVNRRLSLLNNSRIKLETV